MNYEELIKPWFAPPSSAFGIARGILYPVIFVVALAVFVGAGALALVAKHM